MSAALLDTGDDGDIALVEELTSVVLDQFRERGPLTQAQVGEAIAHVTPPEAMVAC